MEPTKESQTPHWFATIWAGIGSAMAAFVVAGVLWMANPGTYESYGALRALKFVVWPLEVWPSAIFGFVFGGLTWFVLKKEFSPTAARIWLWTTWTVGALPLAGFLLLIMSVLFN